MQDRVATGRDEDELCTVLERIQHATKSKRITWLQFWLVITKLTYGAS